ncbi:DUF4124 domain-containing protein [Parendozoicomonas sp. Alg238-R29]|uniref:DUF4124 domain-containing protein n=1 Tax=Parendozoicomonas sp. Alg238-R29 TaxID=2993446 RepID=UPI00248E935A|nr:DUF4124 domain-containing protein [Parendozoicomonas sp. Alg238-R29]
MSGLTKVLTAGAVATFLVLTPVQAEVYKTVDENGNVIFTDKKPKNKLSETVEIGPILTLPATPVKPRSLTRPKKQESAVYKSVMITSPENEQSFQNPVSITITAKVSPAPQGGHRFRLLVDGQVEQDSDAPSFEIKQPSRGAHSIKVQVIDAQGKALISSETSTIYVHRHSVLFKKPKTPGEVIIQPIG